MNQNWWAGQYEDLEESVYVVDLDTHEIVYVNGALRKQFPSDENFVGEKCYEIFQHFSAPCAMCTNYVLLNGEVYEWDFYNQIVQRPFHLKDRLIEKDGKKYRIEIAKEIQLDSSSNSEFTDLHNPQTILAESLRMAMFETDPDRSIDRLLEYMGQSLKCERSYLFEITDTHRVNNTYEWCAAGVEPQKEFLQDIPEDVLHVWLDEFEKDHFVVIHDLETIKDSDKPLYDYLKPQNIHSIIVSPLYRHEKIYGFFGFDNPDEAHIEHIYALIKTIGHFIDSLIDRRTLVRQMEEMSYTDSMTHLSNRHALDRYFAQHNCYHNFGVVYCDVCGLKEVNDSKGHFEGDQLLLRASRLLMDSFPCGEVFRVGGDEFVVLLNLVSEADLYTQCEKLRKLSFEQNAPLAVGCVWKDTFDGKVSNLLKEADFKMYADKKDFYKNSRKEFADAKTIIDDLHRAIQNQYIQVYYQPVIRTINNKLCGFEALARWDDPVYGFLMPSEFIPALEKVNQIHLLDLYVVEEVCKVLHQAILDKKPIVPVSFNISRLDFRACDLFEEIEKLVCMYDLDRDMLNVEITESALIDDSELIMSEISKFRSAGYEVWMDDFGSGYSALNVMKDFRFDTIKLDRAFLIDFNDRAKTVIESSIRMAKKLGIHTLAEGVETEAQWKYLKHIGCEKVQGYYFGKSVPVCDAISLCKEKGIEIEERSWQSYYQKIGSVELITDRSLALIEYENGTFRFLFMNDRFVEIFNRAVSRDQQNDLMNSASSPVANQLRLFYASLDDVHEKSFDCSINGHLYHVTGLKVASHDLKTVYQMRLLSFAEDYMEDLHQKTDSIYRSMYIMHDAIYILDFKNNIVESVMQGTYSDFVDKLTKNGGTVSTTSKYLSEVMIHPDEQEKYIRFIDCSTYESRIQEENQNYLSAYFRTKVYNGSYVWKEHSIVYNPASMRMVYTIKPISKEGAEMLNERLHGNDKKIDTKSSSLWKSLVESRTMNLFWKDKNRRFLGVNQKFLDTYGIADVSELLGKTDEEMHWHIDNEPYYNDEIDVIENGNTVINSIGKCIIRGVEHDIMATKEPLYENGEIVGLFGFFIDLNEIALKDDNVSNLVITDHITGLMSPKGMMGSLYNYMEGWKVRSENFVFLKIEVPQYQRVLETYGSFVANALLNIIGDIIRDETKNVACSARLYGAKFVMCMKCDGHDQANAFIDQLMQKVSEIHQIKDYRITLHANVQTLFADDPKSLEEIQSFFKEMW